MRERVGTYRTGNDDAREPAGRRIVARQCQSELRHALDAHMQHHAIIESILLNDFPVSRSRVGIDVTQPESKRRQSAPRVGNGSVSPPFFK